MKSALVRAFPNAKNVRLPLTALSRIVSCAIGGV